MRQNMEDLERQKKEADNIVKRYAEKHGSIEPETATTH
jgi:hypothetical protein